MSDVEQVSVLHIHSGMNNFLHKPLVQSSCVSTFLTNATMFELFKSYPSSNTAGVFPANWDYVKRHTLENIQHAKEYYRNSTVAAKSSNLLVNILYSLGISVRSNLDKYYYDAIDRTMPLSMALRMTSAVNKGQRLPSVFYGNNVDEVLIATDEEFNYNDAYANWREIEAVRVLTHPFTSMETPGPFAEPYNAEFGIAVIEVNIPKLAVQYLAFLNSQKDQADTFGPQVFVTRYVWPNLLLSHFDHVWFNRIHTAVNGERIRENIYPRTPFTQMDLSSQLSAAQAATKTSIEKLSRPSFENILKTIPAFGADDLYAALILPDVFPTVQVTWALDLARLKHLNFLIRAGGDDAVKLSKEDLNQCVRSMAINKDLTMFAQHLSQAGELMASNWAMQLNMAYHR